MAGGSADSAPPERLHPLMLLTGLGSSIRGVAGGYAGVAYLAATGSLRTAILAGVALLLFLAGSLLLYWRRFSFRVGADEIRIDSGVFHRTNRSIPFDRVQDVDITQGPVARLLGIAKVKFETGGSAAAKGEDGVLPAVSLERAQELRDQVRQRRGSAPVATSDEAETPPVFAMDLRRVLTAGIFNFSLAVLAALFGASQTIGEVAGIDPFSRRFWASVLEAGSPLASYIQAHQAITAIAGLVVLVIVGLITGITRTLMREFRFRLDRSGSGLRRRRGLFTLTDVSLPLRRVQAALIGTGPVRDSFGWRELKLQSLAADEGGKGDHVVAPLARDDEVARILSELGWSEPNGRWERVSPAYIWTYLLALSPLALVAGLGAAIASPLYLAGLALLSVFAGARWLSWRHTGFALDKGRVLMRSGWWRRQTVLLPIANVQSVDLTENAIGRKFGISALVIGVAGGSGFSGHAVPALPSERARELRAELLSRFT